MTAASDQSCLQSLAEQLSLAMASPLPQDQSVQPMIVALVQTHCSNWSLLAFQVIVGLLYLPTLCCPVKGRFVIIVQQVDVTNIYSNFNHIEISSL